MADPKQPPASDDEQLKTATSSSPRSNGPAISAQSFATDMCVTANVTNTQRDESPHTTFTNMSASTCRITDPRLSDTSAGGSSPQRTAAHARPSRSALRQAGVVSQRTGISASRLRSTSRGLIENPTIRSTSVPVPADGSLPQPDTDSTRRSRSLFRRAGTVSQRTGISASRLRSASRGPGSTQTGRSPSVHTAHSTDGSGPRQPVVNPSQIVARVSPTPTTARLLSPTTARASGAPPPRLTMTPEQVRALISAITTTPMQTAATQNSVSPASRGTSASRPRTSEIDIDAALKTAYGGTSASSASRSASRSSKGSSAARGRSRMATPIGRSGSRPASNPTSASGPKSKTPGSARSFGSANARSSGHPTAHPITSDTESIGRQSLRSNSNPATRTPKLSKSGSRPASASRPPSAATPASVPRGAPRSDASATSAPRSTTRMPPKKSLFTQQTASSASGKLAAKQKTTGSSSLSSASSASVKKPAQLKTAKSQMTVVGSDQSGLIRVRVRVQLRDGPFSQQKPNAGLVDRIPTETLHAGRVQPVPGSSPAN